MASRGYPILPLVATSSATPRPLSTLPLLRWCTRCRSVDEFVVAQSWCFTGTFLTLSCEAPQTLPALDNDVRFEVLLGDGQCVLRGVGSLLHVASVSAALSRARVRVERVTSKSKQILLQMLVQRGSMAHGALSPRRQPKATSSPPHLAFPVPADRDQLLAKLRRRLP